MCIYIRLNARPCRGRGGVWGPGFESYHRSKKACFWAASPMLLKSPLCSLGPVLAREKMTLIYLSFFLSDAMLKSSALGQYWPNTTVIYTSFFLSLCLSLSPCLRLYYLLLKNKLYDMRKQLLLQLLLLQFSTSAVGFLCSCVLPNKQIDVFLGLERLQAKAKQSQFKREREDRG
jgi:hypothetical protein